MGSTRPIEGIRPLSRLRTRVAFSYVAVTLVIVLLLETVVVAVVWFAVTRSPLAAYWTMQQAGQAAQVYALQAAVHADGSGLSPDLTFEPGRPTSLSVSSENDPPQMSWFHLEVPYLEPGAAVAGRLPVALLIGPDESVVASSRPELYPVSASASDLLPDDRTLIREALRGRTDGAVGTTDLGMHASVARTIYNQEQEAIGAVYIRAPAGGPPDTNLVGEIASILIPSGMLWLCLMLPIGMVFGVLTTRGLIRRIERLASATARFREGDTSQRVPVSRADEIGQLEQQFNQMAEQLVDSFDQRQALAEQSARREERARIEQEMSSAHYIQKSLLPERTPSIPGWQLKAAYRPAREVGGDLYDFLELPDGRLGIVIGDANGKGVPSALIMATTCAMLRAAAPGKASPGQVLGLVNNLLQEHIPRGTFATCFYAILDPGSGRLSFANAGHNIPLLSRNGDILDLRERGMPLGLMPSQNYTEQEVRLSEKDCVLFYTDGLVEAHNAHRKMFGSQRLKSLIQQHSENDGLIESLLEQLWAFTGEDWEQEDDVTLVMLKKVG